jgi:hypothetical protein
MQAAPLRARVPIGGGEQRRKQANPVVKTNDHIRLIALSGHRLQRRNGLHMFIVEGNFVKEELRC